MFSPMRSEPLLPLVDQTIAENRPMTSESAASKTADDSASLHSTSSKSWGFRAPSLRRRATDRSSVDMTTRTRRTSDVLSEEDDLSGLGTELELELQKQGQEGGTWGIGDEARMSLE